jgi:serine/threonine protein kinase
LADLLYKFEQVPGDQIYQSEFFDDGILSEIEISRAFLLLAQGVQYLHNVQRRLHLNITPESVVITASGFWKLCGFGFSLDFAQGDLQRIASPYYLKSNNNKEVRLEPDLRFLAPEFTDGGYNPPGTRYLTSASDAFSLSLLFYELYRFNLKLSLRDRAMYAPCLNITDNDAAQHLMALELLRQMDYTFLPNGIDRLITGLLQLNTQMRSSMTDIASNAYFVTGTQAVINSLETINMKDIGTQSSLLVSLESQLSNFPTRVLRFIFLPTIGHLGLTNPALWEFAMQLHEALSQLMPIDQYRSIATPFIAAGLAVTGQPETIQTFLFSMKFIAKTFDTMFFQVLPHHKFVSSSHD